MRIAWPKNALRHSSLPPPAISQRLHAEPQASRYPRPPLHHPATRPWFASKKGGQRQSHTRGQGRFRRWPLSRRMPGARLTIRSRPRRDARSSIPPRRRAQNLAAALAAICALGILLILLTQYPRNCGRGTAARPTRLQVRDQGSRYPTWVTFLLPARRLPQLSSPTARRKGHWIRPKSTTAPARPQRRRTPVVWSEQTKRSGEVRSIFSRPRKAVATTGFSLLPW